MTQFSVNGKQLEIAASQEQRVREFMEHVRRRFNSDSAVIASIRVDGRELSGEGEAALADTPLSEISSVEVLTAHPRELAEETLQSLSEFASHLESLSRTAADKLEAGAASQDLVRLMEGFETFTDALVQVKQILRVGLLDHVNLLEADLASILKDLVEFTEAGQRDYMADLLRNHLPANLAEWREHGIPALARARDN
jgi:phosphoenolpyruvate carboxylase